MKKLVQVEEVAGEGLVALMGERVTLFCGNYFYTGKLVGVNDTFVKLEDAGIVYETGPLTDSTWKDFQPFSKNGPGKGCCYVMQHAIESFLLLK